MPIIAFAAAVPLCISTPRATPKIPAAHGRGHGARLPGAWTEHRRNNRRNIDGTTEHRRDIDGTSTEHRITYERAPPRTRGGRGPEGTGKALKPPQPKRKSKFCVFDGTPLPPPLTRAAIMILKLPLACGHLSLLSTTFILNGSTANNVMRR